LAGSTAGVDDLDIKLFDRLGRELARESLYEDDDGDDTEDDE
jgi:hypothetical protein